MSRFDKDYTKPDLDGVKKESDSDMDELDAWRFFKYGQCLHHKKTCATSGTMLLGRIGYYLFLRSKGKRNLEMYVLTTRVYTQGTFVLTFSIPIFYGMGIWASRKLQGLSTEKKRKPLPPDMEYAE